MASTCVTQIHQSVSTRKRSHVRRGTFGPWNPEIYDKMFPSENYPPSKKYDSDRRFETPSRFNSTKQRVEQPSLQKSVDDHRFIGIIDIDVPNDMLFSSTAALLKLMGLAEEENVSNLLSDPAVGPTSQTLAAATCTKTSEPRPSPIQNPSSSDVRALPTPNWTSTNLPAVHSSESLSNAKEPSVVPPIKFDASRPCSPSRTASPRETCAHAPKPLPQPHAPSLQQAAPPVKNAATTLVQAIPSSSKVATRSRPSSPRHGCLGLVGPRPRLTAKDPLRCNHSPDPGSRPSSAKSASPDRPLPTPPSTPKPPALSDVPQFTNPFAPQPILTVGKPEATQHSQFQQQQQQQQHKGKGKGKGKIRVLPAKPPSPRATIPPTPPSPSPTSPDIPIFTNPFAAASPPQRARPPPPNPLYDSPISPTSRRPFDVHIPYTPSSSSTTTTTTVQIPFDPRSPTVYRKPSPPKHPDPSSKNELPIEGPVLSPVEGHHTSWSWSWGRASAAVEKDFTFPPQPLDNVRKLSQPIDPTRDLY